MLVLSSKNCLHDILGPIKPLAHHTNTTKKILYLEESLLTQSYELMNIIPLINDHIIYRGNLLPSLC